MHQPFNWFGAQQNFPTPWSNVFSNWNSPSIQNWCTPYIAPFQP
jgi:hypothetical protein